MPEIKQFTATGEAAVSNITNRAFPVDQMEGLGFLGKSIRQSGEDLVSAGATITRERSLLERELIKNQEAINLTDMKSLYETGLKNIHQEITTPTFDAAGNVTREAVDPFQQSQEFLRREKTLRDAITKAAITPNVALGFRQFVGGLLPGSALTVKHNADLQIVANQKAKVEQQLMDDAQKIGQQLDPAVRESMKTASSAADTLTKTQRLFGPEQAVKMRHAWEQRIEESNMRTVGDQFGYEEIATRLAKGDWAKLDTTKRIAIADHYRTASEHRDNLQDKVDKRLNNQIYDFYLGLAGEGKLDPFREALKEGKIPGLTRHQQATLYNTKELGIEKKEGQPEADQIVIDFNRADPANYKRNVQVALEKLRQLSLDNPKSLHAVRQNMDHIRAVERAMDGQVRAGAGEVRAGARMDLTQEAAGRARMEFNVKRFKDYYESNVARPAVDVLNRDKNQRLQDIKEGELRIRMGEDWEKVSKELVERRKKPPTTDPIDLLQKRTPTGSSIRVPTPMGTGNVDLLLRSE